MSTAPAKIIAVAGARDGVGKSTFVVNAALSLLKETRGRVLVMDLDLESCGDCLALMGMSAGKTVADFAPYVGQLQPAQIAPHISVHASGIGVLPLGGSPEQAAGIAPDALAGILELVKPLCDYIVVDCGVGVNDTVVKVFEQCTGIFILATPDVLVLNHTRRFVDQLQGLHFPKDLMKVVLNRHETQGGLPIELVTRKLQRKVLVTLFEASSEVTQASVNGKPFVLDQPRARISRNYDEFIRKLVEMGALDKMARVARPQGLSGLGGRGGSLSDNAEKEVEAFQKARGSKTKGGRELDARSKIKLLIHKRMVEVMDLKKLDANAEGADAELRKRVQDAVVRIFDDVGRHITDRTERQRIVKEVVDEALGLGPLEDFLSDDRITEIMVNRRDQVYVEMDGKLTPTEATFTDDAQLLAVIERIVAPLGRRIDEKSPMVDARLTDGSRVNAIIPPLAIDGPSITIRKFAREPFKVQDLINFGTFTSQIAEFLRACVEAHLNILISGGTGSGKTTLLNVLSSFIPSTERIITVEDSAELQLKQPHVLRLETRPPNIEGVGEVAIRDLIRNTLRMRPDRIVVGECRGAEAVDMLQAMNTGHDGSLTTIHSNSPRDCLSRLETLVMFAGLDLPSRAIREQIASAIHIIVQQSRLSDGSRRITKISEVTGMEGQVITLQDIFVFKQEGLDAERKVRGTFMSTGFVPRFVQDLKNKGIELPRSIFQAGGTGNAPAIPRGRR